MKKAAEFLFSARLMAVIIALFAISIAVATFIENDFGSSSARALVYNTRWFELLLFIGMINLLGSIIKKKLYKRAKLTVFLFHLSFIVILIGAAITRFAGFEGSMAIQEGQTANQVLTDKTYIEVQSGGKVYTYPVSFSALGKNRFREHLGPNNDRMTLSSRSFVPNAVPDIVYDESGTAVAELVYSENEGRRSLILSSGEEKMIGKNIFALNVSRPDSSSVRIYAAGDSLVFIAPFDVRQTSMADQQISVLPASSPHRFNPLQLYNFDDQMIVLSKFFTHGRLTAKPMQTGEGQTYDAIVMQLEKGNITREFTLWGKNSYPAQPETIKFENDSLIVSYGSLYRTLSFELKLNDFIIERYPGSNSPSWYESSVLLTDKDRNISENRRIYMNNILKYKGYRFYQSSYDPNEKGTVLSVNRDWAGTLVTYAGYLLMALGMFLSLINPKSRFRTLSTDIAFLRETRKGLLTLLLLASCAFLNAQDPVQRTGIIPVNLYHAELAGKLLVQDNDGRIEPLNTLSSDVLKKLYRKNEYKGMTPDQVFVGMLADPGNWQYEEIIRVPHPQIQEIMGNSGKYYAFASFFKDNNYILHNYVETAFQKKPAFRSKFDNEIIRLDERVNICYMVFTGTLFRILPIPGDSANTWTSFPAVRGSVNSPDSVFLNNIIPLYLQDMQRSMQTGDWKSPNDIITALASYQVKASGNIIPASSKISMELFLNKSDLFARLSSMYGAIGFVLLILQFIGLFYTRLKLKIPVTIAMILIIMVFIIHAIGLGMRWYVSGHAPWSNGYEALTYIAWATVLAGLLFASRSSITLSATAILAFLILHTAHLSWMDPQITNLVPVLKSYWLVIHVATITASYGFLALGALMASVNLILMILVSRKTFLSIDLTIRELSHIIEMTLIVGLYMLTIGTFLGGVWANESWGRYWGWDPKETWALVTVLVYAFIAHMRMVPGLRGIFGFNIAALLGFSSVIMTYFGVNYYLSGLHSYAKGDPLPVPSFVYYTVSLIFLLALLAFINYRKLNRDQVTIPEPEA